MYLAKKMNKRLLICLLTCCLSSKGLAVEISDCLEHWFGDNEEETATQNLDYWNEELSRLISSPLSLNDVSRETLEMYPFFSDQQIAELMEYIYDFGPLQSIYELQYLKSFDKETIYYCLPFVVVKPPQEHQILNVKNCFKTAERTFLSAAGASLQLKQGYLDSTYLGKPWQAKIKYKAVQEHYSFAFTAEKDEGEPFDFKYNKGFDFYSAHVALYDVGWCKKLIIGDYKASFGQGLVLHSTASYGLSNQLIGFSLRQNQLLAYTSCSESGYFRGIGACFGTQKLQVSLLSSHTYYNANENLHRSLQEIEKRYSTSQPVFGGHLLWNNSNWKAGICFIENWKNRSWNTGIHYRWHTGIFYLAGELAINQLKSLAFIQHIYFKPYDNLTVSLLLRYYGRFYKASFGNAYAQGDGSNEGGLVSAFNYQINKSSSINTQIDTYTFPYPTTSCNQAFYGYKIKMQYDYKPSIFHTFLARWQHQRKASDSTLNNYRVTAVAYYTKHSFSICYTGQLSPCFRIKTFVAANLLCKAKQPTYGVLLYQDFLFSSNKKVFNTNLRLVLFDIPDYNNRIYCYDPGLLYQINSSAYYGQGARIIYIAKYQPIPRLWLQASLSHTFYTDRNHIGSTHDLIQGCRKSAIQVLLQYQF